MEQSPDVIIVGAGPTGLLLSRELALAGVRVRVLERRSHVTDESRAMGLQARSLEVLDMRGLAEEITSEGNPVRQVRFSLGQSLLNLRQLDSRYGQLHITPQSRTESIFEAHARALGVDIQRGVEVTGVEDVGDRVVVRMRDASGEREESAPWVVGCDGPRSPVRASQGIEFVGKTYPYTIIVADVRLVHAPKDPLKISVGHHGLVVSTDFGTGWFRMGVIDRTKQWSDEPVTLEEVRTTLEGIFGYDMGPSDPIWTSRFRIQERQATDYRRGRVLLAGDAAHVHSPLGGQGLNLGLQDAMNLGWKLAAVVNGHVGAELLDTYNTERRRVSRGVIRATDIATRMMTATLLPPRVMRRIMVPTAMRLSRSHRWFAGALSGVGVRYPDTGVKNRDKHGYVAGDRLPDAEIQTLGGDVELLYRTLRGGGFTLIDQTGGVLGKHAEPWSGRVEVVKGWVDRPEFARYAGVLSRPDGYCAWAGGADDVAGLKAALTRWAGPAERMVQTSAVQNNPTKTSPTKTSPKKTSPKKTSPTPDMAETQQKDAQIPETRQPV